MDKLEAAIRELATQASRLAHAAEAIARALGAPSAHDACRCCGSTLTATNQPTTTCPACRTENAR
jgi:rubrerythrin